MNEQNSNVSEYTKGYNVGYKNGYSDGSRSKPLGTQPTAHNMASHEICSNVVCAYCVDGNGELDLNCEGCHSNNLGDYSKFVGRKLQA